MEEFKDSVIAQSKVYCSDALEGMKKLPTASIDMILTSPPYWSCRDYKVEGQIGLEEDWREYVKVLVTVFREARRVLKPTGNFWLNLGDVYSGGNRGPAGKTSIVRNTKRDYSELGAIPTTGTGLQDKCLMCLPWRVAIALIDDGWILRRDVVWAKPNAMREPVEDRFSATHEFLFHFVLSHTYYFNLDVTRVPHKTKGTTDWRKGTVRGAGASKRIGDGSDFAGGTLRHRTLRPKSGAERYVGHPLGRNPGSYWLINTVPSHLPHFAQFPPRLCIRPILSSCPVGGVVLDPFCGAGTTLFVANKLGRHAIGIDLSPKIAQLSRDRVSQLAFLLTDADDVTFGTRYDYEEEEKQGVMRYLFTSPQEETTEAQSLIEEPKNVKAL